MNGTIFVGFSIMGKILRFFQMLNTFLKPKQWKILIIFLVFLFSIILRIATINKVGRTTDELFCPEPGFHFLELYKKGDFLNKYWVGASDPPPVCRYLYGIVGFLDIKGFTPSLEPIYNYDLTYLRLASIVMGSLAVMFVALLGWEFISPFAGVVGSLIYASIPSFLGLSQLVTQESVFSLLYVVNVYLFLKYLKKPTNTKAFFIGVLLSVALLDKITNVFLILLMGFIYFAWIKLEKKNAQIITRQKILLFLFGFIFSAILLWPSLFVNTKAIISNTFSDRFSDKYSPWEWFFGTPKHVPVYYFFVQFLVRTPVFLLILFLLAIKLRPRKRNFMLVVLMLWFFVPFLQSFHLFKQQGVRYIIQVYQPFALVVALGIEYATGIFSKKTIYKWLLSGLVICYLFFCLIKVSPYYLDYFNELVKGVGGVYRHQLFEIGWWGQGGKDAGDYIIKSAKPGSKVGYKLNPNFLIESSGQLTYLPFKKNTYFDFVVTNYAHYLKVDYNNESLKKDYEEIYKNYLLVHTVTVDGVPLYKVYKHK